MTRLDPIKRPVEVSQNVLCFASSNTPFTLYDCWTTVCRSVHTTQLLHRQLDKLSHVVLTHCATVCQTRSADWTADWSSNSATNCQSIWISAPDTDSMLRRTACSTWKNRGNGGFHNQSYFDLNFQTYHIIIAANQTDACTRTTQPVHGSSQRTEKWHVTSSQELRHKMTSVPSRGGHAFCN